MKDLLVAMKTRAAEEITILGGDKAVHLLADEDLLPEGTPFPCVGFKDGPVQNKYHLSMASPKKTLTVDLIGYVLINDPEGVIVGLTGGEKGILDLCEDIRAAFQHWSPTGYSWMNTTVEESASIYLSFGDQLVQKKKLTMTWTRNA